MPSSTLIHALTRILFQSIFALLALLMRRHVAKMHLGLKQELDWRELDDDADTLTWVVAAVWSRYLELKGRWGAAFLRGTLMLVF